MPTQWIMSRTLGRFLLVVFIAVPLFAQQKAERGSSEIFVGAIAGTPFLGGSIERRISHPLTAIGEVVGERDGGTYSSEIRAGLRYSPWSGSLAKTRAELYGKAEVGGITCASSNSICALGELAVGVAVRGGVLEGSSLEVGYGQTDLGFRKEPAAGVLDLYLTHSFGRVSPFLGVSGQRRSLDVYAGVAFGLR